MASGGPHVHNPSFNPEETTRMALSCRRTLAAALLAGAAAATPLAAQNPNPISISGVGFAQWGAQLDSTSPSNSFDVTRAYLNFIGKFSGGVQTRITGDIYSDADNAHSYRLKYAWFSWTPENSPLTYKFGLLTTPFIDWEEALWDYRMQGPVGVDRNHFMTSSDFGANIEGNIDHEAVDFIVSAVNGTGYGAKPGATDQHRAFEARASVRLMATDDGSRVGGLRVTGYGQLGAPTGGGTYNRFLGMVSYRSKEFLLAGEYAARTDSTTGGAKVNGSLVSVYGFAKIPQSPVAVIARVDLFDPNTGKSGDKHTEIIGGLSYQLTPNVRLLADLDRLSFEASGTKSFTQALFQTQFTY
jgi:hypothetical protein